MNEIQIVQPLLSPGGHRFEPLEELELHSLSRPAAASLPGARRGVVVVPEMPGPLGQPDFIALVGGVEWVARRRAAGIVPQLSQVDCVVLAALHENRPLSLESLSRRLAWPIDTLQPVLRRLERAGALATTDGGSYRRNPMLSPVGTLYALEAKVKDWQRAILQGRAYRSWADNYVILLGKLGPAAERRAISGVAADGAGLFNASGWLVRPKRRRPSPAQRLWGFEHLFAAIEASGPSLG